MNYNISLENTMAQLLPTIPAQNQDGNSFYSSSSERLDSIELNSLINRVREYQVCDFIPKKLEDDNNEAGYQENNAEAQQNKQNNQLISSSGRQIKLKPFTITRNKSNHFRVNRVANYQEIFVKSINDTYCFMLAGDFTVDKGKFMKQNSTDVQAYCPLHNYRPQVAVQTGQNYVVCLLNQSYNGITDILAPVTMLQLLQNQQAFEISSFLYNYQKYLNQLEIIRNNLNTAFNQHELIEQIKQNHINSIKIAREAMEKADKSKVYVFLYMKFDHEACTNKLFFVGGNAKFTEAFLGYEDINLLRQYCQRYSFPHFNDVSGVLNVLYSKFQNKASYSSNLVTFDDEVIPFEGIREFIPLHQLEIAPGLSVGDKFEMRELKLNEKVYQAIAKTRTQTKQVETYLKIEDLGYTLEAEAFISKYYQNKKKAKTNPPTSESSSSDSSQRIKSFNL